MADTAGMVKELREKDRCASRVECKKALTKPKGDMVKAEEILRVNWVQQNTSKAAARIATEGIVGIYISTADGKAQHRWRLK